MKPQTANLKLPTAFTIFCLLSSVFCQPSRATGTWIVDGEVVQTLEVDVTVDDPAALHTDGTRSMAAKLSFDPSVTSLINAYIPWVSAYSDLFILDEDEEVLWLASDQNVAFGVGSLYISSMMIMSMSEGCSINFEEHSLNGGWFVPEVENDPYSVMSRTYADSRYIQRSEGITTTHTVQAGDVLQIQNGIITAINP